LIVLLKI